ncbi:hypothetical protein CDL12_07984 [Handroanthus impetiginosus]|uniref:Uncharacterized protein n=1 Tax=Handroanthus impetiginosus TaxID=429701 RepID=A0A2G9HP73_9LAMI|nr:hypothetical protein CDL12_07984 [Handroanthus impetiginosus]
MASLLLLLSEILRHENLDKLMSSPSPSSAAAPPSSSAKRAAGKPAKSLPLQFENYGQVQFQEDLPRVRVDLVWP